MMIINKEDVGERLFVLNETHEVQLDQCSAASRHQADSHPIRKVEPRGIVEVFQNYSQESGQTSSHKILNILPQKNIPKPAEFP